MSVTTYGSCFPEFALSGETHTVLGYDVPEGIDEPMLEALGSLPIEDETGATVDTLPAGAVARFVEYATRHNNEADGDGEVSPSALVMSLGAERLIRWWDATDAKEEIPIISRNPGEKGSLPSTRRCPEERHREPEACPSHSWEHPSLWGLSTGQWLDLVPIRTWEGKDALFISGTHHHALTDKGERLLGTHDGMFPMWEIMGLLETSDLYDCEEILEGELIRRLLKNRLSYDLQ